MKRQAIKYVYRSKTDENPILACHEVFVKDWISKRGVKQMLTMDDKSRRVGVHNFNVTACADRFVCFYQGKSLGHQTVCVIMQTSAKRQRLYPNLIYFISCSISIEKTCFEGKQSKSWVQLSWLSVSPYHKIPDTSPTQPRVKLTAGPMCIKMNGPFPNLNIVQYNLYPIQIVYIFLSWV